MAFTRICNLVAEDISFPPSLLFLLQLLVVGGERGLTRGGGGEFPPLSMQGDNYSREKKTSPPFPSCQIASPHIQPAPHKYPVYNLLPGGTKITPTNKCGSFNKPILRGCVIIIIIIIINSPISVS